MHTVITGADHKLFANKRRDEKLSVWGEKLAESRSAALCNSI